MIFLERIDSSDPSFINTFCNVLFMSIKLEAPSRTNVMKDQGKKISSRYGIDELIVCMSPAGFNIDCIMKNLEYIFTRGLNTVGMKCDLEQTSILESNEQSEKIIIPTYYEGHCRSLLGYGDIQQCDAFDSPSKAAAVCQTKCLENNKTYVSSGCEGNTIWCNCSSGGLII